MRRWLSVGSVLVLLSVGLAGSATAANPGPIQVPAVQATVKDQCTGKTLTAPFSASLVDATGAVLSPSKTTASTFKYDTVDAANPNVRLQVSASGYAPLGGAADPGVPITKNPGPNGVPAVEKNPGPPGLPGGVQLFSGLKLAVLLAPTAGCPTPLRAAAVTALSGKVVDATTGVGVSGLTVNLVADPAAPGSGNPGPIQLGSGGTFKLKTLACGDYTLSIDAAGYDGLGPGQVWERQHAVDTNCDGDIASGDVAFGTVWSFALQPVGHNQSPIIDWTTTSAYGTHTGEPVSLNAAAHDPDPNDNPLLTYLWSVNGVACTFTNATSLATDITCADDGSASVALTVTDPHGATASTSFVLLVLPGGATPDGLVAISAGPARVVGCLATPSGTVTLNHAASADTFVTITSSDPASLVVPGGGVTIPAGQTSAQYLTDALAQANGVQLTATLNSVNLVATFDVINGDPANCPGPT
jgi:hypothetical protein